MKVTVRNGEPLAYCTGALWMLCWEQDSMEVKGRSGDDPGCYCWSKWEVGDGGSEYSNSSRGGKKLYNSELTAFQCRITRIFFFDGLEVQCKSKRKMKNNFKCSDWANEKMKLASFPLVKAAGRGFCREDQESVLDRLTWKHLSISELYNVTVCERARLEL